MHGFGPFTNAALWCGGTGKARNVRYCGLLGPGRQSQLLDTGRRARQSNCDLASVRLSSKHVVTAASVEPHYGGGTITILALERHDLDRTDAERPVIDPG